MLDSCGSVRNMSAATSMSAREMHCWSAAANSRGCCCRPAYRVAFAAVARKNGHCSKCLGGCCCWSAIHVASAAAARKSGHWSKRLGGCCCSSAPKDATPGYWRQGTARLGVPTVDDWIHLSEPSAWAHSRGDSSFRNLRVRGHDPLHFPALPRCAGYCLRAAKRCCPQLGQMSGSSSSPTRAADSARVPAAGESCRTSWAGCPDGCSSLACCRDGYSPWARCAMAYSV